MVCRLPFRVLSSGGGGQTKHRGWFSKSSKSNQTLISILSRKLPSHTVMAMEFFKGMARMKVKDVPGYLKPMLTMENAKHKFNSFLEDYNRKYIQTSSIKPFYHMLVGVGTFSYFINLPTERRHLRHQQEQEQQGHH